MVNSISPEDNQDGLVYPTEFVEQAVDSAYQVLREYIIKEQIHPMVLELIDSMVYGMMLQRYFPVEKNWKQGVEQYNREVIETLGSLAWGMKRLQEECKLSSNEIEE